MSLIRHSLLLLLFFSAGPVFAQLDTGFIGGVNENIIIEPEFPKPNAEVSVALESFGSSLYNRNIIWRLNGTELSEFNNQREITFTTGELGATDLVSISIINPDTGVVVRSYQTQIEPKYVDIVIEPQTRVPDFYVGRALPSIDSIVNARVLLNDGELQTSGFIYTWRLNNRILEGGPIRGTNQVSFEMPRGSRSTLFVEVSDGNGNILGRRGIGVDSVRPSLEFYVKNPLYGVQEQVIGDSYIMTGSAATIIAEPYNLDTRIFNDPDISEWSIADDEQNTQGSNPYQLTIQKVGETGGVEVDFTVRSTTQLLQSASEEFNVVF